MSFTRRPGSSPTCSTNWDSGRADRRLLDPACGSGIFLLARSTASGIRRQWRPPAPRAIATLPPDSRQRHRFRSEPAGRPGGLDQLSDGRSRSARRQEKNRDSRLPVRLDFGTAGAVDRAVRFRGRQPAAGPSGTAWPPITATRRSRCGSDTACSRSARRPPGTAAARRTSRC